MTSSKKTVAQRLSAFQEEVRLAFGLLLWVTADGCLGNSGSGVIAGLTTFVAAGSGAAEKRFSGRGLRPMDDPAAL